MKREPESSVGAQTSTNSYSVRKSSSMHWILGAIWRQQNMYVGKYRALNSDVLCQSAEALSKLSLIIYVQSCANFNRLLEYDPLQLHLISIMHHGVLLNFYQLFRIYSWNASQWKHCCRWGRLHSDGSQNYFDFFLFKRIKDWTLVLIIRLILDCSIFIFF